MKIYVLEHAQKPHQWLSGSGSKLVHGEGAGSIPGGNSRPSLSEFSWFSPKFAEIRPRTA